MAEIKVNVGIGDIFRVGNSECAIVGILDKALLVMDPFTRYISFCYIEEFIRHVKNGEYRFLKTVSQDPQ